MRSTIATAAVLLSVIPAAHADALTIELPGKVETTAVTYVCAEREIAVTYHNSDGVSLAVFDPGTGTVVASSVISASGARYAGGQYVWWTKGEGADLYDLTRGENASPETCAAK